MEWITQNNTLRLLKKKNIKFTHKTRENLIWVDQMNRVGNALKGKFILGFGKLFLFLDTQT